MARHIVGSFYCSYRSFLAPDLLIAAKFWPVNSKQRNSISIWKEESVFPMEGLSRRKRKLAWWLVARVLLEAFQAGLVRHRVLQQVSVKDEMRRDLLPSLKTAHCWLQCEVAFAPSNGLYQTGLSISKSRIRLILSGLRAKILLPA